MASGLSKCHPVTAAALEDLGVTDRQVTQAYGNAPASAGFHAPEGKYHGRPYSSCVDLAWELASVDFFHRMAQAGFAVFFRDWPGNRHIHAVHVGLTDDHSVCRILAGPRQQIIDWCKCADGLHNHGPMKPPYKPTPAERECLRKQYAAWVAHTAFLQMFGMEPLARPFRRPSAENPNQWGSRGSNTWHITYSELSDFLREVIRDPQIDTRRLCGWIEKSKRPMKPKWPGI